MMISLFDIFLSIIILYFAVSSYKHGLIRELFGKLSFILGLLGGVFLCGLLTPYLDQVVRSHILSVILSFLLIFTVIFLFLKIIQILLSGIFKGEILKSLDKALGFFFGVLEGVILVCLLLISIKAQPWISTVNFKEYCFYWEILEETLMPAVDFVASHIRG